MRLLSGLRRLHDDDSGQAMVEFVLVFPVQLLLSLLILQFCFVAHAHLVVEQRLGDDADDAPSPRATWPTPPPP